VSDRRHVDPEQGQLTGEGADQQVAADQPDFPTLDRVESRRPEDAVAPDGPTYYDQPIIKEPVWIWSVPAYFYTGGAASGAAILGAVAQLADRDGYDRLVSRCRYVAAGGTTLGTAFLIHDLGRPARFLNMLRVFRPTSAMSMGSWTLAASGTTAAAAVALPLLGARRLGDVAGLVTGALAPALGTYTAVLISDTAVPVWQATRRSTPALFAASGIVAATSALEFGSLDGRDATVVRRLGVAAKICDLAAGEAVERTADRVDRIGRPLHDGASGALWRLGKVCTAASLAVSLVPVPTGGRRGRRLLSAVLGSVGSLATRFGLFHAGTASARDPRATFEQQRAGQGGAEIGQGPAVTGAGDRRAG
jgi:hypothetical protein